APGPCHFAKRCSSICTPQSGPPSLVGQTCFAPPRSARASSLPPHRRQKRPLRPLSWQDAVPRVSSSSSSFTRQQFICTHEEKQRVATACRLVSLVALALPSRHHKKESPVNLRSPGGKLRIE